MSGRCAELISKVNSSCPDEYIEPVTDALNRPTGLYFHMFTSVMVSVLLVTLYLPSRKPRGSFYFCMGVRFMIQP